MSQQNIDFGTFPDDPSADPIRIAFQKVQQNFDEVYSATTGATVTSINRLPGAGITVSSPTGNVIVSANIASINFSSTTLKIGTAPNPVTTSATYVNYSQTLHIELPDTLTVSNIVTTGNVLVNGTLTATTANLGNAITANYFIGSGNNLSNVQAANITGEVANATYAVVAGSTDTVRIGAQPNITSTGTLVSLSVSGNANIGNIGTAGIITSTGNINAGNLHSAGSLSVTGNANVGNIGATNGVFTNVSGNGANLTSLNGSNVTGTVASAQLATYATTANSVAGANVTGEVSYAATANSVAGANVTGEVSYAATANSVAGANVTGQVSNALVAGTVYTNAQPNITSTGTLSSLSVSGDANVGNLGTVGLITASGNITGGNVLTGGIVSATGNITGGNLIATVNISAVGNANVGNIGATNGVFTNVSGNGANLTSLNGSNVTGQVSNALVAGTVYTNAQPNITSVGTLSSLSVSGNANVGNLGTVGLITASGNINAGNLYTGGTLSVVGNSTLGNVTITGILNAGDIATTRIADGDSNISILSTNGNITMSVNGTSDVVVVTESTFLVETGTIIAANIQSNGALAGNLTIGHQPNITSVGSLSSLSVVGNSNLGSVSNVHISGGSVGTVLGTDGSGNLNWISYTGSPPGGSNTDIQFNDAGSFAGNANLSFNKVTSTLFVGGNISITGNITGANNVAGTLTTASQPNITSVGTLSGLNVTGSSILNGSFSTGNSNITGHLTVTGNITAGNISGGNLVSANYFSGDGSNLTNLPSSGATIVDTTTSGTYYPTFANATSGSLSNAYITSDKLYFDPNSGQLNATDFNSLSDKNAKTNIKPLANVINVVSSLDGVSFDWIDGTGSSYGFIAQDVEKILPHAVSTTSEGKKSVNYSAVIPFLVETIKEQQKEIVALKSALDATATSMESILKLMKEMK